AIAVRLQARTGAAVQRGFEEVPAPASACGRILIVDDNEDAAFLLAEALRRCNYAVHVANQAMSALQIASYAAFDAAILDLGLPTMDGLQLAAELRQLPGWETTKLIALSGYGGARERAHAREAGFVHHFVKPVDLDSLLRALGDWLSI